MKFLSLIFVIILGASMTVSGQSNIDVTKLMADTKTFLFDDDKNTVKGYIIQELVAKTTCCGSDRIYLEVKIDPSGHVLQVKTLTGKNDCFKKSAIDIVKNVKWNTEKFKGPKPVYFEIKPNIDCGDRTNSYAQVEVFNNDLLDKDGKLLADAKVSRTKNTTVTKTTQTTITQTEVEQKQELITDATKEEASKEEAPGEVVAEPVEEAPKTEIVEVKTEPKMEEVVPETIEETKIEEVVAEAIPSADVPTMNEPMPVAENPVSEDELGALKKEMEAIRQKEEELALRREKRKAYIERRRAAYEARKQRREEAMANADGDDDSAFFDDEEGGDDGDPNKSREELAREREQQEQDRFREQLSRLEDERRSIEENQRRIVEEQRRARDDMERIAEERVRIEEEIRRAEEESIQRQEELELQRIEEEKRRIEDSKLNQQQNLERLLAEMQRLQEEQSRMLEEIKRNEDELLSIQQGKISREQEIMADRLRRQQEIEAELKMVALQNQMNLGRGTDSSPRLVTTPGLTEALNTASDSERSELLIKEIATLQAEIRQMQDIIAQMQTGNTGTSTGVNRGTTTTTTKPATPSTDNSNLKNANDDRSWEKVDYKSSKTPEDDYEVSPPEETVEEVVEEIQGEGEVKKESNTYDPVRGYSPDESHKETHKNVSGPRFSMPNYSQGDLGLKDFIKDKLREGGVCGLAQAFAEVTVGPKGDVIGYKVLDTNAPMVMLRLPGVLQSLKFNELANGISQNAYIEFKADILCGEGDEADIDLKKVDSYIKNNN